MQYFMIILFLSEGRFFDCVGSSCSSCSAGYLYYNTCLSLCPSGFTQNSNPNICSPTSLTNLFNINFWIYTSFAAKTVGGFQYPGGTTSFNDPSRCTPIPTKERGFYFASTSMLRYGSSLIPAPNFTLRFSIRVVASGTIFQISYSGITYIKVTALSGVFKLYWLLTPINGGANVLESVNIGSYSTTWTNLCIYSSQSGTTFTFGHKQFSNFEFLGQVSSLNTDLGDYNSGSSFTGFLMEIIADNTVITTYTKLFPQIPDALCNYNQYYDGTACQNCQSSCSTWPWCVSSTCDLCYDTTCSTCTGYRYSDCTTCSNSAISPGCAIGKNCAAWSSTFACTSCNPNYVLIDGLCLSQPTPTVSPSTHPIIDINFGTFSSSYGGIFYSGLNPATYAPYNSPELDDPYPVKSRGLYFDGGTAYLRTANYFTFNYKFTIAMWMYSQNYYMVWASGSDTLIYGSGYMLLTYWASFTYPSAYYSWYSSSSFLNLWYFMAYTVDVSGDSTIIVQTANKDTNLIFSIDGERYYATTPNSYLYIGKYFNYVGYNWHGFLYTLTVWQTAVSSLTDITAFSSYYDVCGSGLNSTCLWNCSISDYYNSYQNAYVACDSSCTRGCSTWGTCDQCLYANCSQCANYNSTCTSGSTSYCTAGMIYTGSNHCCSSSCRDCYEQYSYTCTSCVSPKLLLAQVCVTTCPLGYKSNGSNCVVNFNPIFNLTLNQVEDSPADSVSGIIFSTGLDTKFYPNGGISDPIPAKQRGYYFTSNSLMASANFILPYNLTMVFYMRQILSGAIFSKNGFIITTQPANLYVTMTSVAGLTSPGISTTNWIIMAIQLFTDMTGTTALSLSYPYQSSVVYSRTSSNVIFLDSSSPIVLGGGGTSFTGFIYQIIIFIN